MEKKEEKKSPRQKETGDSFSPLSLALELGYVIAIPIVVFGLLGRFLDKKFDSSPVLLLAGILVSIIVSSIGIYSKVRKIIK